MGEIFIQQFFSYASDYIEPMVMFIAWTKMYSAKYFCNAWVSVLGEILSSENFWLHGKKYTSLSMIHV